jgi:NADH:ubiquinone reductase (H+-translocating)
MTNFPIKAESHATSTRQARPRVLIIGGGFAGLRAARGLSKLAVDATIVDRQNHHTFQPLLYQVALGLLSPADITQLIRAILRKQTNVEVLLDEALTFDLEKRRVRMASGVDMVYDYLVVATGATHSYFGKDEWAPLAPGLKSIEDATEIRRRIITAFEMAEREMVHTGAPPRLTFVVIGGGPSGVELAGAIADLSRHFKHQTFRNIEPGDAKVILLEGSPRILASYPEDLSAKALQQLTHQGVVVRTGARVTDIQPEYVALGEERIAASVVLWGAGVQASPLGKQLGCELDKRGRVIVDEHLNPPEHAEIFICGDLAHAVEAGREIPGVAQPAMQMGTYAASMIGEDLAGKPRMPFHYVDKGDMSTIGRFAAVAKVEWPFKAHWGGLMAWLSWLIVHISLLLGFSNRLSVFWKWSYGLVTSTCGALIFTSANAKKAVASERFPRRTIKTPLDTGHPAKDVAVLFVIVAMIALAGCKSAQRAAGADGSSGSQGSMAVPVATVDRKNVALTGEWVATTDGNVNAQIQAQVTGYIIRQDYKEGAVVREGQVLFEIDPRTYEAQLDQATASVAQAKASVAQAKATLGLANINVQRDTPLAEDRAIAQSQLDNEVQTQQADQASVEAAQAQVSSAQAQVRFAALNLGFTKVRSLIGGVAGQAAVQVGNLVNTQSVLTSVSQVSPIKVYFAIGEQEYLALSARAKSRGKSDLLASGNTIPLQLTLANGKVYPQTGRIIFVDRSITSQTGSIRLAALFPNPDNLLRPGQFARVTAETDELQNAVLIPQRAVNDLQGQNQVYVVSADDTVKAHPVQLGQQIGEDVVITSGLRGDERVATESLDKLTDGMKVQPQSANLASNPTPPPAGLTKNGGN